MLAVADMDALNSIGGVRTEVQAKLFVRKVPQRRNYRDSNIGRTACQCVAYLIAGCLDVTRLHIL